VHTSTITVAVLPEPDPVALTIAAADLEWHTKRGSGPGGQHRNKTESAVELRHVPSGLVVRCESERSQLRNKESALAVLRARLWNAERARTHAVRAADRRAQVGSGMRGDKRRTIRMQDGQVHDHVLGKRWSLDKYLTGDW
jgi:peptide chain release factor 1